MPNAKIFGVRLRQDDAYLMQSGGGGFGSPLDRDPDLVAFDVREEYVSRDAARQHYGVVVSAEVLVDEAATQILRGQIRTAEATGDHLTGHPI